MLPKIYRLKSRIEFTNVYKNGKFFYSSPFVVNFIPNGLTITRIGFSIGKAFSKRAVDRNRAKRVLREVIRMHLGKIQGGFDIIISQKNISPVSYDIHYVSDKILFIFRSIKITKNTNVPHIHIPTAL